MLNPTRDPCVPSSDSPPGSLVLSAHPKARAFTAHHMPCGFPIRGRDPGFPGQGISCSPRGGAGRGAGRTQPLCILGILGASPSQLPLTVAAGGTGPVPRCPGMAGQRPARGAPWI